jgi:hypothetical protein
MASQAVLGLGQGFIRLGNAGRQDASRSQQGDANHFHFHAIAPFKN